MKSFGLAFDKLQNILVHERIAKHRIPQTDLRFAFRFPEKPPVFPRLENLLVPCSGSASSAGALLSAVTGPEDASSFWGAVEDLLMEPKTWWIFWRIIFCGTLLRFF